MNAVLKKNDKMVMTRPYSKQAVNSASAQMSNANLPVEILWLSADLMKEIFEALLMARLKLLAVNVNRMLARFSQ